MGRTSCGAALLAVAVAVVSGCSSDDSANTSLPGETSSTSIVATTEVSATFVAPPDVGNDDPAKDNRPPQQDEIDTSTGYPRICVMVSLDEVSQATGATAVASQEGALGDTTTCFVDDADGEKIFSLAAAPSVRFDEAAAAADARPVGGLGDGAVWSDGRLHVLMGDEDLSFGLYPAAGVDDASAESVVEQIAAVALPRYEPPPVED